MWVSSVLAAAFLRVVILLPDIQNRKSDRDSHFFFFVSRVQRWEDTGVC